MNNNNTPAKGTSIYMNGCNCEYLRNGSDCNCGVGGMRIGMTYVPMQPWEETYDLETGLNAGTIFPCLHLPFMGGDCNR